MLHVLSCLQALPNLTYEQSNQMCSPSAHLPLQYHPELLQQRQSSHVKPHNHLHALHHPNLKQASPAQTPSQLLSPRMLSMLLPPDNVSSVEQSSGFDTQLCIPNLALASNL